MAKITRRVTAFGGMAAAFGPLSGPLAAEPRLLVVNLHHIG